MARDFAWKIRAHVLPGRSAQASAIASTFLDELGAGAPDAIRGEAWSIDILRAIAPAGSNRQAPFKTKN
jgi:hypothetical protein